MSLIPSSRGESAAVPGWSLAAPAPGPLTRGDKKPARSPLGALPALLGSQHRRGTARGVPSSCPRHCPVQAPLSPPRPAGKAILAAGEGASVPWAQ